MELPLSSESLREISCFSMMTELWRYFRDMPRVLVSGSVEPMAGQRVLCQPLRARRGQERSMSQYGYDRERYIYIYIYIYICIDRSTPSPLVHVMERRHSHMFVRCAVFQGTGPTLLSERAAKHFDSLCLEVPTATLAASGREPPRARCVVE